MKKGITTKIKFCFKKENSMKKLFLLTVALVMTLSLAACGGETNTTSETSKPLETTNMVDITTDKGISMKLPSDLTLQENLSYINAKTGDSAVFMVSDIGTTPLSGWKEENILATYQAKYKDVVVKSFENGKQINGKESLVSKVTLTTPEGNAITIVLVLLTDGKKNYMVNLTYGTDIPNGSLVKNVQACIDSITIK
jgi:uncharacterized lipoprotein YehR (DUF1307 family)